MRQSFVVLLKTYLVIFVCECSCMFYYLVGSAGFGLCFSVAFLVPLRRPPPHNTDIFALVFNVILVCRFLFYLLTVPF